MVRGLSHPFCVEREAGSGIRRGKGRRITPGRIPAGGRRSDRCPRRCSRRAAQNLGVRGGRPQKFDIFGRKAVGVVPPEARAGVARSREHRHHARHLLPRVARHGRHHRRQNGRGDLLEGGVRGALVYGLVYGGQHERSISVISSRFPLTYDVSFSRGGGIRTHTVRILSPLPLPLGYAPARAAKRITSIAVRFSAPLRLGYNRPLPGKAAPSARASTRRRGSVWRPRVGGP